MLVQDFRGSLHGEVANLRGFLCEINVAGGELEIEGNGLAFEFEKGDQHGGTP